MLYLDIIFKKIQTFIWRHSNHFARLVVLLTPCIWYGKYTEVERSSQLALVFALCMEHDQGMAHTAQYLNSTRTGNQCSSISSCVT